MSQVQIEMTKDTFMHAYASQYYDPVKAHEYYERTKKLKGRRPAAGMSEEQKQKWGVVKEAVTTEKKQKVESQKAATTAEVSALRSQAAEARVRISEKLRGWLEAITTQTTSRREALSESSKAESTKITE